MNKRRDIVNLYNTTPLTKSAISKHLGLSKSTVHYWIAHQAKSSKKGRPRLTDCQTDKAIIEASLKNPFMTVVELQKNFFPLYSVDVIRNRLKNYKFSCRTLYSTPFLTEDHCRMRFAFASSYLHWTSQQWQNVVFLDEKHFQLTHNGMITLYRNKVSNVQSTYILSVWMIISDKFRKLYRSTEMMFSNLDPSYILYMQNNHTIKNGLQRDNIKMIKNIPLRDFDLNPIENVWKKILQQLKGKHMFTKDTLWEALLQIFDTIPDAYFEKLIHSMPHRVFLIYQNNGYWI